MVTLNEHAGSPTQKEVNHIVTSLLSDLGDPGMGTK